MVIINGDNISHQDPIQPSPAESRAPPEIAAAQSAGRSGPGTVDPRRTQRRDLRPTRWKGVKKVDFMGENDEKCRFFGGFTSKK